MGTPLPGPVHPASDHPHQDRWHELDWLRVLAIGWMVLAHTGNVVAGSGRELWLVREIGTAWRMPLLYVIAGASCSFTLARLSTPEWLRRRFQQLLWPLAFGMAVVVPLCLHLAKPSGPRPQAADPGAAAGWGAGSFYSVLYERGQLDWGHMWFLAYLVAYTGLAIPIFQLVRRSAGHRLVERLLEQLNRRGGVLLLGAPLLAAPLVRDRWLPHLTFGGLIEPRKFLLYFLLYVLGFGLAFVPGCWEAIARHRRAGAVLAVALLGGSLLTRHVTAHSTGEVARLLPRVGDVLDVCTSWFGVVALLGYGRRHLRFTNAFLRYATGVSFAIYVLHFPILLLCARLLEPWRAPLVLRLVTLYVVTVVATLALCETVFRRTRSGRRLLGVKAPAARPGIGTVHAPEPVRAGAVPAWLSVTAQVRARRAALRRLRVRAGR